MINDLIGLSYERRAKPADGHGKTDCFMLLCEMRRRLGLYDYETDFCWAYDEYEANNLPMRRIIRWLLENGKRVDSLDDGNAVIMKNYNGELAVGVAYNNGILTISNGGKSFWARPNGPFKIFRMIVDEEK